MAGFTRTISVCSLILAAVAVLSCDSEPKPYSHESARRAAADCYSSLINGDFGRYLSYFTEEGDSLPAEYAAQLADMSAQFLSQRQQTAALVRASAVADSLFADSTADVFLEVVFADSAREVVCLPMAFRKGKWMAR